MEKYRRTTIKMSLASDKKKKNFAHEETNAFSFISDILVTHELKHISLYSDLYIQKNSDKLLSHQIITRVHRQPGHNINLS